MYEAHFQLNVKPFEATNDPAFYYPVAAHHAARLKIQYAIECRRAAALLVGPPGIGKSLLVHSLTKQLTEASSTPIARIDYPLLSSEEMLCSLACAWSTSPYKGKTSEEHLRQLTATLQGLRESGKHGLLIVEEAHLLRDPDVAEVLRIVPYLGGEAPAVTVLLVGQSSLAPWLNAFPAWEEHFGAKCHLPALTCEETMGYVAHRIRAAGAPKNPFTNRALEALFHLSSGAPRRINRLADLALLVAFAEDLKQVEAAQVESVSEELTLRAD